MHKRCASSRPNIAKRYKDRGIAVCEDWATFAPFMDYMLGEFGIPDLAGERLTIDRIDNDKGYCPGNVRWSTYKENIRNRSSSVYVEYMGSRMPLAELAEVIGMPFLLLSDRIRKQGWTVERAISEPANHGYEREKAKKSSELMFEFNGKNQSLLEWRRELGFNLSIVKRRLNQGWTFDRSITAPLDRANALQTKKANRQSLLASNSVFRELPNEVPSQNPVTEPSTPVMIADTTIAFVSCEKSPANTM